MGHVPTRNESIVATAGAGALLAAATAGLIYTNLDATENRISELRAEINGQQGKADALRKELSKEEAKLKALQKQLEEFLAKKQEAQAQRQPKS